MRELRQLRDGAGLGHAELAARAHFPYDSIRAAEIGPALPDLPVLSAYVRGCGGTTEEWEERWRSLTRSPSLPVSASRHAGQSDAADAGARIGAVTQAGDSPDPSVIIAALNRVAEEMAGPGAGPASPAGAPSLGVQQADDFPTAADAFPEDSFPSAAEAVSPASEPSPPAPEAFQPASEPSPLAPEAFQPAPEPFPPASGPADSDKPAGWDPIRVSTAWPAIRDTPALPAEPARSAGSSGDTGMGVPWGTAPWDDPLDAPPPAASRAGSAAQPPARAPGTARGRAGSGTGQPASWTRIAVIAVVLMCVLAVLLAVFA